MIKLQSMTRSFRFKTEEEHPKEFILTWNGEDLAINTKSAFIPLVALEIAKEEVVRTLNLKKIDNGKR